MTTLRDETVKAKKDHLCDLCRGKISEGETYRYSSHVDETIYSFRTHLHCHALSHKLKMYDDLDDGLDTSLFGEIVYENYITLFSPEEISISEMAVKLHKKLGE